MIDRLLTFFQVKELLLSDQAIDAYSEVYPLLQDEDIADVLWLAEKFGGSYELEEETISPDSEQSQKRDQVLKDSPMPLSPLPTVSVSIPQDQKTNQESTEDIESPAPGLSIQVQTAPALPEIRSIGRSLRPLMRKVPSLTQSVLDEVATVDRIAERDIWLPILKPAPERWLDLELVIEASEFSEIWKETLIEFQHLLEHQGAFRNVRAWTVEADKQGQPRLISRQSRIGQTRSTRSPKELVDPSGRRLVLFVSDCRSQLWKEGQIHEWLALWSRHSPAAIVQLLPERLWAQSELDVGFAVQAGAMTPGVPNHKLTLKKLSARTNISSTESLTLPIVTLTADSLKQLALVVSAAGRQHIPTRLFDLSWVNNSERDRAPQFIYPDSPEARVELFKATASPLSQALAHRMAAAPVDLSVVHLIQQEILPQVKPIHIAEVYSSGLLEKIDSKPPQFANKVQYDFVEGVRSALNKATPRDHTLEVIESLSQRIARTIGFEITSFTALLTPKSNWSQEVKNAVLPFAQVTTEVLHRLGGEYAELAQVVEASSNRISNWVKPAHDDRLEADFPPLETFEFIDARLIDEAPQLPFIGHTDSVNSVAFSPDGQSIVSGSSDRTLRLWSLDGQPIGSPFQGHTDSVNSVAFSPDGQYIVSGSRDRTLRLWTLDGQLIGSPFEGHADSVNSVAFLIYGKSIVSGSSDRTLRTWTLDGQPLGSPFVGHADRVNAVAFSPDGERIISGSSDHTVQRWSLEGTSTFTTGHSGGVNSVAYSPDGKLIVTGKDNNMVSLWTGDIAELDFSGHTDGINAVAFSPDGQLIVSASLDNTLRVWNLKGELIATVADHSDSVNSIAFSPDGKSIVSASDDQSLRLISLSDIIENEEFPPPLQTETFTVITLEPQPSEPSQQLDPFPITVATLTNQKGQWQIQTQQQTAHRYIETLPNDRPLEMIAIPSGTFIIGSSDSEPGRFSDESPQHEVTLAPFFMGRYPITQSQWQVVANLPRIERELDPDPSEFKGDSRPVEQVSWYEAVEFCARLSAHTGRDYRLPTEAEWEYACRAGTTTPFHFGDMITTDVANYDGSAYADGPTGERRGETTPVDHFDFANALGLSDMHGNVDEWCQDHWRDDYEGAPTDGSAWITDDDEAERIQRGGSWDDHPRFCRSAYRNYINPGSRYKTFGFRVSCSSPRALP